MRKRVYGRKLNRSRRSRTALFRSLIRSLAKNGRIKTTLAKAKAVQPEVDKMIGLLKQETVSSRRLVYSRLGNDRFTTDELYRVSKFMKDKVSGFTKLTHLSFRSGDNAEMAMLEWSSSVGSLESEKKKRVKKSIKKGKDEKDVPAKK